jgi:uncharacterized protein (TIGR00369 family)
MNPSSVSSSPRALAREISMLARGEYAARLGLRAARLEDGRFSVEMPFDGTIVNRGGKVHGGAIASVLMAAARLGAAASERAESERRVRLLTANVGFLCAPQKGPLVATAEVVRRGREVAHMRVDAVDEDGATIANAGILVGFVESDVQSGLATGHQRSRLDLDETQASPVPASPYLTAAGVSTLPPAGRSARALLPKVRNRAENPVRVDEGAVAGLADSCAAYAAHLYEPQPGQAGGVTVSLALAFQAGRDEDLLGVGEVTGHVSGCYLTAVEVVGVESGIPVASGFAVYRLPA